MAESSKSTKDPVLEQKFLSFLKERIGLHETLSIKNLTGHLSALSPHVRNHFGASRSCLKQFLTEHPKDFYVDKKDNVKLVKRDSSSTSEDNISERFIAVPTKKHSSGSPKKTVSTSSEQFTDFPKELVEVHGKIYRLFPAYGFISVTNPIVCSVYFNVNCFENGRGKIKDFAKEIAVGEGVYLNAKKGPDNVEAQYRATKVWRVDPPARKATVSESSTTRSGLSSPVASCSSKGSFSNTSTKKEIYGTGKIDNMFMKFGFISQNNMMKDNVFFHVKTLHKPGFKRITNLMDVLKVGDTVNFSAIPTEQKNTLVRWQATRVWTDNDEVIDGNEIYYSSPEGSLSSDSVESFPCASAMPQLPSASRMADQKTRSQSSQNHLNCVNDQLDSSADLVDRSVELSNNSLPLSNGSTSFSSKPALTSQMGTIWPRSEHIASIVFGKDQKALALLEVFYQCEERIDNFLWEIEDGQRIQFEAVEDSSWAPEYPWKVTLAWVGRKPEASALSMLQLKEIYTKVSGESSDNWLEPENVTNDAEDDEDEDFVEENLENDLINDDSFARNNDGPTQSDLSGNEGTDLEDHGFEENMETVSADNIPVAVPEKCPVGVKSPSVTFPAEQKKHEETGTAVHAKPVLSDSVDSGYPSSRFAVMNPSSNDVQREKYPSVPKSSTTSWAEITEDDDMESTSHSVASHFLPVDWRLPESSQQQSVTSTDVSSGVTAEMVQHPTSSSTSLEKRVEELVLVVQELLKRVPLHKSVSEKSTQTETISASTVSGEECSSQPRPSTTNQEAQTVSTGPLMYTQLYYSQ